MNIKTLAGAAAAAAALCAASSAAADPRDAMVPPSVYSGCDGYGVPAAGGDGMTKVAMVWGIFNPPGYGNTGRTTADRGRSGIQACDVALSDGRLKPDFWMRRVSLIHARALHRLEAEDFAGALADLDLAQAAVQAPNDPFFARSLGLSMQFARAYALRQLGQGNAADEIAARAAAQRPYTRTTAMGALVAMGDESTSPEYESTLQALARFQPSSLDALFLRDIDNRRWDSALSLCPQLRPPERLKKTGGWANYREVVVKDTYRAGLFSVTRSGACAYALAATGRGAEARAYLAKAAEALNRDSESLYEPILQPGEKPPSKSALEAFDTENDARRRLAKDGPPVLKAWSSFVEHRILVAEHRVPAALEMLRTHRLQRDPLSVELLDALIPQVPASDVKTIAALKDLRAQIETPLVKTPKAPAAGGGKGDDHRGGKVRSEDGPADGLNAANGDIYQLFEHLPQAETTDRLPRYKKAALLFGSQDGFTVKPVPGYPDSGGEAQRIEFRGLRAQAAVVEELAILRAADVALQSGKSGFVMLDRDDTEYSITSTMYGMRIRTDPNGFGTSLTVVFVDKGALPERFRGTPWRVIDAQAVYDALAPIYIRAERKR